MIRYTFEDRTLTFNPAREKAHESLKKTLAELYGKDGISEKLFRDRWLSNMSAEGDIFADGWYCPPPFGMAVLFGDRITFDSLRNEPNWPGDTVIDWERDLFYAYASPVDKTSGRIGDTSVTLYFGSDRKIRDHIRKCHDAVMAVFGELESVRTGGELFKMSQRVFRDHGLVSDVISRTDSSPVNLGHTFTVLEGAASKEELGKEDRNALSKARMFSNVEAEWGFEDGLQFTVEPQLLSISDPSMPQITQHYVVEKTPEGFVVCNDIDEILTQFDLI